ncbi:hypothetical protein [Carboxylicivirga marina]|uniref:hypothetical protein n=1 Tax=Carboxylicivirga marina TaxID=2800988 RepID=UPI002599E892|nr:hypothetical protein [uncultured Carboxylicivirga sp.]
MIKAKGKIKTQEFVDHLGSLLPLAHTNLIDGFKENQRELLKKSLDDANSLIENNEWGIGLENLLTNLYEIEFNIDNKTVKLAFDALKSCGFKLEEWKFIEELKSK